MQTLATMSKIDLKLVPFSGDAEAIPAVLGATIARSGDLDLLVSGVDVIAVALGVIVSMVVGYLSLKVLLKVVMQKRFHWFALYCWTAGALVILSQMV